jgi:hypothetical protein
LVVKPLAQLEELVGRQVFDRLLDLLHGAHGGEVISFPSFPQRRLLSVSRVFEP